MSLVRWTPSARRDLTTIHDFISQDSELYADRVVGRLSAAAEFAAEFPMAGRTVLEISDPSIREVISRPYRIVYEVAGEQAINVLRVLHGARSFPESL